MSYLQGCDLSDLAAEASAVNHALVEASDDWDGYRQAVEAGRIGVMDDSSSPSRTSAADVRSAKQADQKIRSALSEPTPDGELGEAITRLRLLSMCEVDLATGEWLQSPALLELFSQTEDIAVLADLMLLALHMDHLPDLQERYAEVYLHRYENLGLPLELGLRLRDRSLINLGLPQRYATLILCEARVPVFAGRVDLNEANRLRQQLGLAPEDLGTKAASGYCG